MLTSNQRDILIAQLTRHRDYFRKFGTRLCETGQGVCNRGESLFDHVTLTLLHIERAIDRLRDPAAWPRPDVPADKWTKGDAKKLNRGTP